MLLAVLALALLAAGEQDLLSRGQKAFDSGDFSQAEELFRQYLKLHPNSAEAMSNLAAVYSRRGEFPEAVSLYQKALQANSNLIQIHFNLGVAQLRSGNCQSAVESFRVFLKKFPGETRARELLGLCLVELGQLRQAVEQLEAVQREKPKDASMLFSLAYAHARAGDAERGKALMAELESHPAETRLLEGLIEFRRERYREAKAKFEESLQHDPNYAPALAALGRMYLHENEDGQAIVYLEKALQRSPQDAESCYQLGVLYDRNHRTAEAKRMYERAVQLRARFAGPLYGLAKIELREDRPAAAVKLLEEAVRYAPEADAIQLLLGRSYQSLGRTERAKEAFAEVRRIQQNRLKKQQEELDSGLIVDSAEQP